MIKKERNNTKKKENKTKRKNNVQKRKKESHTDAAAGYFGPPKGLVELILSLTEAYRRILMQRQASSDLQIDSFRFAGLVELILSPREAYRVIRMQRQDSSNLQNASWFLSCPLPKLIE